MAVMQGVVNAPSSTSATDGTNPLALMGKSGELVKTDLHGQWYTAAYRGKLFHGGTAAAGTTIPISSTTAPTFTLYNPIGSGVNLELVKLNIGITNATTVVSPILLGVISGLLVAPTSVTALTTYAALVGGNASPIAQLWSAATLAAAAAKFYTIDSVSAASGSFPNFNYDFNGTFVLTPGSLVFLCGTAAQTSASSAAMTWAEWPQ